MRHLLSGAGAIALAAFAVPATSDNLVWRTTLGDGYAFVGVVAADEADSEEPTYPFSMVCSLETRDETVVSGIDAKALGAAIANDEVPSFRFVLDGVANDDTGGEVADIRFGQMYGDWEYVVYGEFSGLLRDAKTVSIAGVGIKLDLPAAGMSEALTKFGDACGSLDDGGGEGPSDG
jgi:hypothetical protein